MALKSSIFLLVLHVALHERSLECTQLKLQRCLQGGNWSFRRRSASAMDGGLDRLCLCSVRVAACCCRLFLSQTSMTSKGRFPKHRLSQHRSRHDLETQKGRWTSFPRSRFLCLLTLNAVLSGGRLRKGVAGAGQRELAVARSPDMPDFEDALVASAASSAGCDLILTRNVEDFAASPVMAVSPAEFLAR